MKKTILFFLAALLTISGVAFGQSNKKSVEVLYFKANLACCKAKACNALEGDIKAIIEKNFPKGNVIFKVVKLADDSNKVLVEKYKAQSQTVVLICKKKKKEVSIDVTDMVSNYNKSRDKDKFEKEFLARINENL
ncbi:MAG: hypothetical protein NTU44_15395 [Bacteroidetes bacterium]|nr:hypothetical protein [Bacteroidota bacterium]